MSGKEVKYSKKPVVQTDPGAIGRRFTVFLCYGSEIRRKSLQPFCAMARPISVLLNMDTKN